MTMTSELRPTKARMTLLGQIANGQVLTDLTEDRHTILLFPHAPSEWQTREIVTGRVRELEGAGWVEERNQVDWVLTDAGQVVYAEHRDIDRVTGRNSPGLAPILATGVGYSQLDWWVRSGYLHPEVKPAASEGGRDTWSWPPGEQAVAVRMARLYQAGLRPEAAEKVARARERDAVVLGPQIVISIFPLRAEVAAEDGEMKAS